MATIAQQGEDIPIRIKGDENINLDVLNFAVTLYLANGKSEVSHTFKKEEYFAKPKDENEVDIPYLWVGTIPARKTSEMELGTYNMELLVGTKQNTNRSIYSNKNFLTIEYSVSQNVSLDD